jgi:subtilisin family serine protease
MSLGCFTDDDQPPDALGAVLDRMPPDLALIAGAGNKDTIRPMFPAGFNDAFAIGALDGRGARADFSNWGSWLDGCATGVDVRSSFFVMDGFEGYARWSGTSFAAPQFAGAVAARVARTGEPPRVAANCLLAGGRAVPGLGAEFQPQLG